MIEVSHDELMKACKRYEALEKRGGFYDMALKLIESSFDIEAFILILATWNFARFRYVMKKFDIDGFRKTFEKECQPIFLRLKDKKFETVNFDEISDDIKRLYDLLSVIKGVEQTGAPKLMHLKIPGLFVMWDNKIKQTYGFRNGTAEDYVNFLKKMQVLFRHAKLDQCDRTLAKRIDEYNYVVYTLPKLDKDREKRTGTKTRD